MKDIDKKRVVSCGAHSSVKYKLDTVKVYTCDLIQKNQDPSSVGF